MCPTAGRKIEISDINQTQVAGLLRRKFTQAELPRFFQRHKTDSYRTVFSNHLIGQPLGLLCLRRGKAGGFKINGAALFTHVEADGGHIKELNESGGEHMLAGMLLHMIAPADSIDSAPHLCSCGKWRGSKVQNAYVFFVRNFCDRDLLVSGTQHAGIVNLASAGGIKSSAVKDDNVLAVSRRRLDHASIEV